MNSLQMRYLLNFCRKHELDPYLIDNTLTYSENKGYLESLVPDFDPESRTDEWEAAEEQYLADHALSYYLVCMLEGKTKSKDVGEPISKPPFSLRTLIPVKAK